MLKLDYKSGRYHYSIFHNPVARVMKFERFATYVAALPEGQSVLDYGAGDRPLEPFLRTKFRQYIAADYAPANASHSRQPDIFIEEDASIDLDSGTMDCVAVTEVLEHIYEPKKALAEINRILKQGGALIGTVPFAVGEHEQPYDYYRYTSYCLRKMLEETGFTVVELDYVGDGVGVAVNSFCNMFKIITKALNRGKFRFPAKAADLVIGLPGIVYYFCLRAGINPGCIAYYRKNPLGFTFYAQKK